MLAVLPHFVGSDFEFVALAPSNGPLGPALSALGIPILSFDARDSNGERRQPPQLLQEMHATAARVRPDLIHGNSLSMGRLTSALAAESGVPSSAHLRDIIGLSQGAVRQLNANRALVAVSQAVRDYHAAQGIDAAQMHVVYNGIDVERLCRDNGAIPVRGELGLPADAFLVAIIGQMCLRKGQDVFANGAILAAPKMPGSHFLVIGERYSEKTESVLYEEGIRFEVGVAGISGRFHRMGYRSDVARLLREIDLVVHCARQEPFGRVLLEAAAAERPIIATTVGGTPEMLVDGESAILIPPDKPELLADSMLRLYSDPAQRRQIAAAAKARVMARFSIEKSARALGEIWRTVL